jgi:hypothetical protein
MPSGLIGTFVWLLHGCGLWGPIFMIFGLVAAMWACRPIRTIAMQTFVQCLRMRIAAVILLLLAVFLAFLPSTATGDGTLAGRIRTFLSYATFWTSLLLTVASVLMSVRLISSDVQTKQIFTIMTKPIARWQYVLGRWLGLVTLNAVLLAVAGAAIYGSAQYLRGLDVKSADDLRAVETEIFSARERVSAQPLEIDDQLVKRLGATAELATAREEVKAHEHVNDEEAVRLLARYAKGEAAAPSGMLSQQEWQLLSRTKDDIVKSAQSVGPMGTLHWDFNGIAVSGNNYEGRAKVAAVGKDRGLLQLEAPSQLLGKLSRSGPITVDSAVGTVLELEIGKPGRADHQENGWVLAAFDPDEFEHGRFASIKAGQDVPVIAEPVIQIQYKANAADVLILTGLWTVGPRDGGMRFALRRSDPNNATSTLTVPARAVDKNGCTRVTYTNVPGPGEQAHSISILNEDVSVLYKVGGFELPLPWAPVKVDGFTCNFMRGIFLILFQLMFICGVGILAGSCLSFAVGSLASFVVMIVGLGREFIATAMIPSAPHDVPLQLAGYIFSCVKIVVPDLSQTSPGDSLVDGLHIPWAYVAMVAAMTVGLTTLVVVAAACAIFRKRELARVQV